MTTLAFVAAVLLQAPAPEVARPLAFSAVAKDGGAIRDLALEEVAVVENGVARQVSRLEADTRPLALVVIVDDSMALGAGLRFDVVGAVETLLKQLPAGTRYSLWLTNDRPTRVVEWSEQASSAANALRSRPQSGGNTIIDALAEATRDLAKREGERTAVVAITGTGPELSHREKSRAVEEALPNAELFLIAEVLEGGESFPSLAAQSYVLGRLATESGGQIEQTLTTSGLPKILDRFGALLSSRYTLTYKSAPDLERRKLEITIARPEARTRISPPRGGAR